MGQFGGRGQRPDPPLPTGVNFHLRPHPHGSIDLTHKLSNIKFSSAFSSVKGLLSYRIMQMIIELTFLMQHTGSRIFVLQKKTLKAITFSDIRSSNTPIFCDSDLLTLCDIHNLQEVAAFVFECVNGLSPSCFHEYLELISSKHTIRTRQSIMGNLFFVRRSTDQYGKGSIQFYGVIACQAS